MRSCFKLSNYNTSPVLGGSFPRITFNPFHTSAQYLFIFTGCQKIWKWSALCSPHSLQLSCGTHGSPLFNLCVMKYLTMFFQQNVLQHLELVVVYYIYYPVLLSLVLFPIHLLYTEFKYFYFSPYLGMILILLFWIRFCMYCTELRWFHSVHQVNPALPMYYYNI